MGATCCSQGCALRFALSVLLLLTVQRTSAQCPHRHTKAYQQRQARAQPGSSEGQLAFRHAGRSFLQTSAEPASPGSPAVSEPASQGASGNSACSLAFNNQQLSFRACESLALPSEARLLWTVTADPAGNGTILTAALDSSDNTGWQSFGFAKVAGEMTGGKAVIVKSCASCASGASVAVYNLDGETLDTVYESSGALNMTSSSAAKANGRLTATFTLRMPQTLDALNSPLNIIAADGPIGSGDIILEHEDEAQSAGQLTFGIGAVVTDADGNEAAGSGGRGGAVAALFTTVVDRMPRIHGWLMAVSWGALIPLGVLVARYMRNLDPWWFHLHRAIQLTGVVAGLAGMGVGIALGAPDGTRIELAHRVCGFIVSGLGVLQVLAIILRPTPKSAIRRYWNWYHWWAGRAAVALAIANMYTGLRTSKERLEFYWAYTGVIGAILVLAVILELVVKWRPWSRESGYHTGVGVTDEERDSKVSSPKEAQFITSVNGHTNGLANGQANGLAPAKNGAQFIPSSNRQANGANGVR